MKEQFRLKLAALVAAPLVLMTMLPLARVSAAASASLVATLTPNEIIPYDYFGESLAISGNTVAVAAQAENSNSGVVYLYERSAGGPDHWGQVKRLTAPDAAPLAYFIQPTLDGDTLVVGAGGVSKAYVFERNAGGPENWGLVKALRPNWGGDGGGFGFSALHRDTLVVGASLSPSGAGRAFIFERNAGGEENWGLVKVLEAPDGKPGDYFFTPAVSGDTIVVGAQGWNSHQGAVYLFERNAGGVENWGLVKEFTGSDSGTNDGFGVRVSLSGDTLVVGSPNHSFYGSYAGAVYLFERNAGGAENWGEVKKITSSEAVWGGDFGIGLSVDGDRLAVGAPEQGAGSTYLFARDAGGLGNWGQVAQINSSNAPVGSYFGAAVGLAGSTLVAAAYPDTWSGAAYVFALPTNQSPVAAATGPASAVISPNGAGAQVLLDGSHSFDPDGNPLTYTWYEVGQPDPLATGPIAQPVLTVGVHEIALVVSDGAATATNVIAVEVITTTQAVERLAAFVRSHWRHTGLLVAPLEAALPPINRGKPGVAINHLVVFRHKVHVEIEPSAPGLAQIMTSFTDQIINALHQSARN